MLGPVPRELDDRGKDESINRFTDIQSLQSPSCCNKSAASRFAIADSPVLSCRGTKLEHPDSRTRSILCWRSFPFSPTAWKRDLRELQIEFDRLLRAMYENLFRAESRSAALNIFVVLLSELELSSAWFVWNSVRFLHSFVSRFCC